MMRLNKLGQLLDPVDVVVYVRLTICCSENNLSYRVFLISRNGSRHLHGLSPTGGVEYGNLQFRSLDTSVVSIGKFSNSVKPEIRATQILSEFAPKWCFKNATLF